MRRLLSSAVRLMRLTALAGIAAGQLWCATNDDSPSAPPPDQVPDASTVDAAHPDDATVTPPPPTCTPSFCRVALPGSEVVALNGVFARSESDVWVVGSSGFAARFDGSTWQRVTTNTNQSLFSVWAASGGPVWGTSTGKAFFKLDEPPADGGLSVFDGGWTSIVTAVSGSGANDAYAVGSIAKADPFGDNLEGDNIWHYGPAAAGSDAGTGWRPVSPDCPFFGALGCVVLRAVWVQSAQVQWFAGENGKVYRTDTSDGGTPDGGSPNRMRLVEMNSSSLRTLDGLWGFAENDVWAVGAQGALRHWVGGDAWVVVPSPVTDDLHAVWGSRSDDVWAVGDRGVVLHWDGTVWSVVPTPFIETNRPRLYAVSGTGRDVWIAGESTLLRAANGDGGAQ